MSGDGATTDAGGGSSIPERIGGCRVLRRLGSGGMGSVHLAMLEDDRPFAPAGTKVALKVLHPGLVHATRSFERFRREGRIGLSILHENVVRVHDVDSAREDGVTYHFLIQEFVEGRTLRALMKELEVVPEALLRDVSLRVARGLAAIHAAGAVHRDLKPENVFITPDHQVKLVDLGIAQVLGEASELTAEGVFIGTMQYAAPEQFRGEEIGHRADLYAWGVVAYEAATGQRPVAGKDFASLMHSHLEDVPRKLGHLNPEMSPFFEEVVATLLEKNPEKRFHSASELGDVLDEGESSDWWCVREQHLRSSHPGGRLRRIRVARPTVLVGREEELDRARDALRKATAGQGQFLLVEGEAGVGKTRFVDEFLALVEGGDEDLNVLYGAYPPGGAGGGPGALTKALIDHFGETTLEEGLARHLTATPRLVPSFVALLRGEPAPEGAEPLSTEGMHAAFCHLARSMAKERPVVWVMEDLNHGTAASRAVVASLARIAYDQRLLLLVTCRRDLVADDLGNVDRLENAQRITLDRLSPREVIELLGLALRSPSLAERLGGKVAAKSDGNPFFVLEMLRELKEREYIREKPDGTISAVRSIASLEVPSSVKDLMLARLRDVDRDERALLDVAAVQGVAFDADLVARVREMKRLQVLEAMADLVRRRIVAATGAGFRFDHHQMRQVVYQELPPLLRREYHGLLADAELDRSELRGFPANDVPDEKTVFLARHFLLAGRLSDAADLVLPAMDHVMARRDLDDALELAELALEALVMQRPVLRCEVRLRQAECFNRLGEPKSQRAAVEDALASADEADDPARSAKARLALGRLLRSTADYSEARDALQDATWRASQADDPATEARCVGELGLVFLKQGKYDEALRCQERMLVSCKEAGDVEGEAIATSALAAGYRDLGQYDLARELYERFLGLCVEHEHAVGEVIARSNLGLLFMHAGDHAQAREQLERQLELCHSVGYRRGEASAIGNLAHVLQHLGDLPAARKQFEAALGICRDTGDRRNEIHALQELGSLDGAEGRLESAHRHLQSALDLSRSLGTRDAEAHVLHAMGELARSRGENSEAGDLFEQALRTFDELGTEEGVAGAELSLGRHLLEMGDSDQACGHFEQAERLVAQHVLADPGPLPGAYLALLGRRRLHEIAVPDSAPVSVRAEAHLVLHLAGGGEDHLAEARELLGSMSVHLSQVERDRFWEANPTARAARAGGIGR